MPGNLPSERRRSGSSTPGHVRPEGTPPRKSEATQAKTAPAHASSTQEQAAVAVRCWRPSRQGAAAWEGPPRQPPATPGAARATAATGLYGVSRVLFLSGGRLRELVPGVAGRLLLLLCDGELRGSAGNSSPVDHHSQATGAANARTAQKDGEAERRGNVLAGRAGRSGRLATDTEHPGSGHQDRRRHRCQGCRGRRRATRREHRQPQLHQHTESG